MSEYRRYSCEECGHIGKQKVIEVNAPLTFTVRACKSGLCPFYHTYPVDSCAITCSELDGSGKYPVDCPVNMKVVRVRTAEVNY